LNILHPKNQKYLIKHQNIINTGLPGGGNLPNPFLLRWFKKSKMELEKGLQSYDFRAVTLIFGHVFRFEGD